MICSRAFSVVEPEKGKPVYQRLLNAEKELFDANFGLLRRTMRKKRKQIRVEIKRMYLCVGVRDVFAVFLKQPLIPVD